MSQLDFLFILFYFFVEKGNLKMAVRINEELLHKFPGSTYGLINKELFENQLLKEREKKFQSNDILTSLEPVRHI